MVTNMVMVMGMVSGRESTNLSAQSNESVSVN